MQSPHINYLPTLVLELPLELSAPSFLLEYLFSKNVCRVKVLLLVQLQRNLCELLLTAVTAAVGRVCSSSTSTSLQLNLSCSSFPKTFSTLLVSVQYEH